MNRWLSSMILLLMMALNISANEYICQDHDSDGEMEVLIPFPANLPVANANFSCHGKDDKSQIIYRNDTKGDFVETVEDFQFVNVLALELSKSIDDALTGDFLDVHYIANEPFVLPKLIDETPFIFVVETKYDSYGEASITVLHPTIPRVELFCIDQTINYNFDEKIAYRHPYRESFVREILLSASCQKAIEAFNIPLKPQDIARLVPVTGSLN